jgi:hypothetical protein
MIKPIQRKANMDMLQPEYLASVIKAQAVDVMMSTVEVVTPELAVAYLYCNRNNRRIRERLVSHYAQEMRSGRWALNHQGIAFGRDGSLQDGQHRLHAIIESGVDVTMLVTRGVPVTACGNDNITTMDTLDSGCKREVGDQLSMREGIKDANKVASSADIIRECCVGRVFKSRLTTATALSILEIYRGEIEFCISKQSQLKFMRTAGVTGSIAFAMKVKPDECSEFITRLRDGEGLHRSGPTSPIFALRRHYDITPQGIYGGGNRINLASVTLNALKSYCMGDQITRVNTGSSGINYFKDLQPANVQTICEMFR